VAEAPGARSLEGSTRRWKQEHADIAFRSSRILAGRFSWRAPALPLRQDLRYDREINDGDVARCDIRSPIVDFHGMRAA